VCEGLTLASEMKDSSTIEALAVTDAGPRGAMESSYRKSSLPESTQKPSKPPVPVFRKRTSAGNCLVTDVTATIQEHSADSRVHTDVVDSGQSDSKSDHKSAVKSNGLAAETTTVGEDVSTESQNVSASSCRQQVTPTPSLLSAVLATSAASIAMITIQGPSSTHSATAKQKSGDYHSSLTLFTFTFISY